MPSICCTEFSRLLAEAVESHRSVDSAPLREHAAQCADCRAQWLDALLVDRAVARWKSAVPAVELAETVLFRLADQAPVVSAPAVPLPMAPLPVAPLPGARRRLSRRTVTTLVAACSAVCIAIFLVRPTPEPNAPQPDGQPTVAMQPVPANPADSKPAASPASTQRTAAKSADAARVDLLVRGAGTAYLNLASEAAEAVTSATVLVPPPDSTEVPATPDRNDERWVDEVQRELRPVTQQLSQAFEFLLQAVPAEKAPAT